MEPWPELSVRDARESLATLTLYAQIVGKIRLALTPPLNEWWNVPLYLTTRGLTTSPMPYGERTVAIDFDFIDHAVVISDSDGREQIMTLAGRPVADFCRGLFAELAAMNVPVMIGQSPQEIPVTTRFADDYEHRSYDAGYVHRLWSVLRRIEPVFQQFRAGFRGKCSPVHLFWGHFDLAVTRFSGRRAPWRQGVVDRLAYDEENISIGFWPGDPWTGASEAMFYAYTAPQPAGFDDERVRPDAAFFDDGFQEFMLPYEAVRSAVDPAREILAFADSAYEAGARLAAWDTDALAYRS